MNRSFRPIRSENPSGETVTTSTEVPVPRRPDFPGAERIVTVPEALEDPDRIGETVVVIDADGNWPTVVTAEHLANLGKQVTVVTNQGSYGWRITVYSMLAVGPRFREKGIKVMPLRSVRAVEGRTLILEDRSTGETERLEGIDGIVAALGGVAEDGLYHALRERVPELRMVGDCVAPRTALEAIYEGHEAGRAI